MSRIGKAPIVIPAGVEVKIDGSLVTVKGKGVELKQVVDKDIICKVEEGELIVQRPTEQKRHKALHGLYRSLLANMVTGVTEGFKVEMELVGVGFRATAEGQILEMALGFSHPVVFMLPKEVKVEAIMEKGKAPRVVLESFDKQLIGQIAARIRSVRKPEPYKGKGIKFVGEVLRRKEGKSAKK
ncbi:MAG: 50S ribosomal protein L6 [Chitinophagales bacterium]|nr:50S ribosomal protein L6 [Bacteroidota bacterium]MCB9255938.1 50S ribosomal protein L6 [Chitinophagales bacterium]